MGGCRGPRSIPESKAVSDTAEHVHTIQVAGRRVRYLDQGTGHPLVLCHGFIGSLENFHSWSPAFSGHRRVLIPDLPGCGETEAGAGPFDTPAYARFVGEFVDAIGIEEHDVGGICLGATVALEYAAQRSDRVTRLVLHTPVYSPATLHPAFRTQVAVFTAGLVFWAIDRLRRNRTVSDLYKRFLVEGPGVDPYDAQVNFDNQLRADGRSGRAWLRDGVRRDYEAFLRSWDKPALIVVAANDRVVRLPAILALEQAMPKAELRVIDAAGHGWTPALIDAQVQVISGFLAR